MSVKICVFFSLLFISLPNIYGQIGGRHVYDFLNLTTGPSVTAVGGVNVSTMGDDLHMAYQNPALLTDSMDNHLVLSYTDYLSDIGFGYAGYSRS
ncbi:MAG: penicillin-binding protein, partial [Bacteroidota bacterium]